MDRIVKAVEDRDVLLHKEKIRAINQKKVKSSKSKRKNSN